MISWIFKLLKSCVLGQKRKKKLREEYGLREINMLNLQKIIVLRKIKIELHVKLPNNNNNKNNSNNKVVMPIPT